MTRRARLLAACLILASASCTEPERRSFEGPTVRLASSTTSAGGLDVAALSDRDTTTGVALAAPLTLTFALDHDVELRAVKVHAEGGVDVSVDGAALGEGAGSAGWSRRALEAPLVGRSFSLVITPTGDGARVTELELWGAGLPLAPRDPLALALRTREGREEFEDALVVRAPDAAATLEPAADSASACVTARFDGFPARAARRAYLAYEARLPRAVSLTRSLDGALPVGGLWLGTTAETHTLLDELDPERLDGSNEVRLCLPGDADASVALAGVRLLLVLDSGTDHFDRETRRALGSAADGDARTAASFLPGPLELRLDRPVALEASEGFSEGERPARAQVGALEQGRWSELAAATLGPAPSSLGLETHTLEAARLTFAGARPDVPAARLTELRLEGSGVGRRVSAPRVVITYPDLQVRGGKALGERFGSRAYVLGWAESPSGPGTIEVGGARLSSDGVIATPLERPLDASGPWEVVVRARFPDGTELTRVLDLADDRQAELRSGSAPASVAGASAAERYGRENQTSWAQVDAAQGGKVRLGTDVEFEAPPGAVAAKTAIGISRKGAEIVPPLDAGMVNVTAPGRAGYKFLPAGQKFAKPVKVRIPYDPALLPEGVAADEIQTYFYDAKAQRWQPLPRTEVSRDTQRVTSETTHFTFMINAVLVLPDHPGPTSFNPNSIKDLKASEPSTNIDFIEPPQANAQGTAALSFPLRLPKARGAYQPSLSLTYDSSAGNGWVGVGWALPVSSVAIDARFGVPLYDGSERYVLDGAALVPVDDAQPPGGSECVDGTSGRRYFARVERDFKRIVRCGGQPTDYRFEVTDRNGTLFVYGASAESRLTSSRGTGEIGEWYLQRVIDLNGNLTVYGYDLDTPESPAVAPADQPVVTHHEPFVHAYLKSIEYSGKAPRTKEDGDPLMDVDERGAYRVSLRSEHVARGAHLVRPDVLSSARLGFKDVTRRRLKAVRVRLVDGAGAHHVRGYQLEYETGTFGKSRAVVIKVYGAAEDEAAAPLFYSHTLSYFDAQDGEGATPFSEAVAWSFSDGADDAPISQSEQWGFGVHGYLGVGPLPTRTVSVGVRAAFNQSFSSTTRSLLDVNGDGLPDRLQLGAAGTDVRFNDGARLSSVAPRSDAYAGRSIPALPLSTLGQESSTSFNVAVQGNVGPLSGSFGWTKFWSSSTDMLVDADGDGLVDVLSNGQVLYNQPRNGAVRPECALPENSPSTFCFAGTKWVQALAPVEPPDFLADLGDDPEAKAAADAVEEELRPADALVEWLAPYAGEVDVSGALSFLHGAPEKLDPAWDGVRLQVYKVTPLPGPQHYQTELLLTRSRKLTEAGDPTPVALEKVPVTTGTRLYFVLSTLANFPVDEAGPTPLEEVSFAPAVTYVTTCSDASCAPVDGSLLATRDAAGASNYRFDARDDFRLGGVPLSAVTVPRAGTLEISSTIQKRPSSDDVRACIQRFGPAQEVLDLRCDDRSGKFTLLARLDLASAHEGAVPVSWQGAVQTGDKLVFRLETDLSIDPGTVGWDVRGQMTSVCGASGGTCTPPAPAEVDSLSFVADAYLPLHLHVEPTATAESLNSARPRAAPVVGFLAPAKGTLHVDTEIDPGIDLSRVTFAIRKHDRVLAKGRLQDLPPTVAVELEQGEQVYLEAHSETPFSLTWKESRTCTGDDGGSYDCSIQHSAWHASGRWTSDESTTGAGLHINATVDSTVRDDGTSITLLSPFGGGYHGWRYGVWGGPNGEPIDPLLFEAGDAEAGWSEGSDEEQFDAALDRMNAGDESGAKSADRLRAERVQPLLPRRAGTFFGKARPGLKPGTPAYVSKDGNVFVTAGTLSAGREGGYVVSDGGAGATSVAAAFRMGRMSRASAGDSLSGGLNLLFAGVNVGGGESYTKADVRDMNGDGIIDVLSASGPGQGRVRVTDLHSLRPRSDVSFNFKPEVSVQHSGDLSVAFNLGVSDAIKTFCPQTSIVCSVTSMFPSVSGGLGLNLSATKAELHDVNGDGLPDAVRREPGSSGFWVRLNLGTRFAEHEDFVPATRWRDGSLDLLVAKLGPGIGGADTKRRGGLMKALRDKVYAAAADPNMVRRTTAISINDNLGAGLGEEFAATVNWESSVAATAVTLSDVNGDGLPDYVRKSSRDGQLHVMLNTGYGFDAERAWNLPAWPGHVAKPWLRSKAWVPTMKTLLDWVVGAGSNVDSVEASGTYSEVPTIGFVYSFAVPIGPFTPWLHASVGGDVTPKKVAGFQLSLQDVNGDGLPDHVLKAEGGAGLDNGALYVRVNQLDKANLLRQVDRPLGGTVELDYARSANSVDMPASRWTLASVTVRDGRGGAPGTPPVAGHDLLTRFLYEGGMFDRAEREFLGFSRVERVQPDGTRVVQRYRNSSYVERGLQEREELWSQDDRLYTTTDFAYAPATHRAEALADDCVRATPFFLAASRYCDSFRVDLRKVTTTHYEGQGAPHQTTFDPSRVVSTTQEYLEYDAFGNVASFHDAGDDADPSDDAWASVTYESTDAAFARYAVARPRKLEVRDAPGSKGKLLRKREAVYDARGNLAELKAYPKEGAYVTTSLKWNAYGMLEEYQAPEVEGGRDFVTYGYDDVTHAYATSTKDAHDLTSSAEYDHRFGVVTRTVDTNGNVMRRVYDAFGRTKEIYGPQDPDTALVTVKIDLTGTAYALTHNRLPDGSSLDTVVVMDGMLRTLQTKKTAEVSTSLDDESTRVGWTVSGHQTFDVMGRVFEQGQPFFEPGSDPHFSEGVPQHPTTTLYDPLGRAIEHSRPADPDFVTKAERVSRVTSRYAVAAPPGSAIPRLLTRMTDPNGNDGDSYRSAANRMVAFVEHLHEQDRTAELVTRYEYDPLGQLLRQRDAQGALSSVEYDLLGQRTSLVNPDLGAVTFVYDAMGNILQKQDANLRARGPQLAIRYEYHLGRLVGVHYPEGSSARDVTYEYGKPGAPENGAGRVVRVLDDAGVETRGYGQLGELVRTTRTLRPLKPLDPPLVLETRFSFDPYGRMLTLRYPDAEVVTYGYDRGGLLKSVQGDRPATDHYPAGSEPYLRALTYDEMGQRRFVRLGNGAVTRYTYDERTRRPTQIETVAAGRTLQKLRFGYDLKGHITDQVNALGSSTEQASGTVEFKFEYDSLDRLKHATGSADARPGVLDEFESRFTYTDAHAMERNTQVHRITTVGELGVEAALPPHTNHDLGYAYATGTHRATRIGDTLFTYDRNGNQTAECTDHEDPTCSVNRDHLREFRWDEENRLTAVVQGGGRSATRFIYDAAGERLVKLGTGGPSITVGQFFSMKGRTAATKHIFAGETRLASKLLPPSAWQSPTPGTGGAVPGTGGSGPVADNDNGCDPSDYQPQKCPIQPGGTPVLEQALAQTAVKPETYYYHADHLGSTAWVTDQNGKVHEHVEYFPFGAVWREPKSDADGAAVTGQRFLFSGKELDEETGLYFVGARYYDPVRARWLNTDPLDRFGTPAAPKALNLYNYTAWNPVNLVDPDGRQEVPAAAAGQPSGGQSTSPFQVPSKGDPNPATPPFVPQGSAPAGAPTPAQQSMGAPTAPETAAATDVPAPRTKEEVAAIYKEAESWNRTPYAPYCAGFWCKLTNVQWWKYGEYAGPGAKKGEGADCSGSAWAIFNAVGLKYDYTTTGAFDKNPRFAKVSEQDRMPGDLVVWPGNHVVIYAPGIVPGNPKYDTTGAHSTGVPFGPGSVAGSTGALKKAPVYYRYVR